MTDAEADACNAVLSKYSVDRSSAILGFEAALEFAGQYGYKLPEIPCLHPVSFHQSDGTVYCDKCLAKLPPLLVMEA